MNTTELVRFVERAEPRTNSRREATPLFYTQLAGPTRQAILRARQRLLSEQSDDGSWSGVQTGDASLPSRLIFLLAYFGDERSHLAQQAAASILDMQLPGGGWPRKPGGEPDVSVSVQTYFALKLSGMDPTDERLRLAHQAVRDLGGTDAADEETRRFLALLGQISFDACQPAPPELAFLDKWFDAPQVPHSLVWSHRPVHDVGMERGVRELFIKRPHQWQSAAGSNRRVRSIFAAFCRYFERQRWTPFRRRALERAEAKLYKQIGPTTISTLDFGELVWSMIALRTIGHVDDSEMMRLCRRRLDELVHVDDERDRATPQPRTMAVPDTLKALESLQASGVAAAHPCVSTAVRFLSRSRRVASPTGLEEVVGFLRLISSAKGENVGRHNSLPPDIEVTNRYSNRRANLRIADTIANRVRPLATALVARVLAEQNRNGSWRDVTNTGIVLEAIAHADCVKPTPSMERAISFLRSTQLADGSWADETGAPCILATTSAIRGLVAADVAPDDEMIAAALNWLTIHQLPSGAWHVPESPTHTAAALAAFIAARRPNHPATLRAVNFLVESQNDQGGWNEPNFLLRDAATGRPIRNALHASAEPLFALSRWAVAAASAQSERANARSFRVVGTAAVD